MDSLDTAVVYGVGGGLISAGLNWVLKDSPRLDKKSALKYTALFAAMGCLGGSFLYALTLNSGLDPVNAGLGGGFVGSYLLIGLGNYF
jgi:hypothetical protein